MILFIDVDCNPGSGVSALTDGVFFYISIPWVTFYANVLQLATKALLICLAKELRAALVSSESGGPGQII